MSVEKVCKILKIAQDTVSLETPVGDEENTGLADFIPAEGTADPAELASLTFLKEQMQQVLGTLTDRERRVIELRFGLDGGRPLTLEEVGKEFHVTRERIRQIESKALRKLRNPNRGKVLRDFLD